jgi:hypothetical protein
MAFSSTSFYAGVGTVIAAVTIGFAGGAMFTTSPKMEPNRLERLAASNPPAVAAKAETPPVPSVPAAEAPPVPSVVAAKSETAQTPAPDRMIATTQPPVSQPPVSQPVAPPQPQPVVLRDDAASQIDNAKKVREGELRKQAELKDFERRGQQRRERKKRQEIDAAVTAVKQMKRDGVLQEVTQQDETPRPGLFGDETPRAGFFGRD